MKMKKISSKHFIVLLRSLWLEDADVCLYLQAHKDKLTAFGFI